MSFELEVNTISAARILGCSPETLKSSRSKGTLNGLPSPVYIKRGKAVFYSVEDLALWKSEHSQRIVPGE